MDHRCLYGHRVPESFKYAIQQRICPTCGAPTVTLLGYRLARRLTKEIPLDPIKAFNAIYLIEGEHEIQPVEKEEPEAVQVEHGEVTLSEDESRSRNGRSEDSEETIAAGEESTGDQDIEVVYKSF